MSFKETSNCLLFFSAKNFLESIGTTFEYRYTKAEDGKFILQFRALKGSEWKTKPVSFCITHHGLKKDEANNFYSLEVTTSDAADEAFAIVNVQDFLNQLMLVNGPVGRTPIQKIYKDESELQFRTRTAFTYRTFLIYIKNLVLFAYELVMVAFRSRYWFLLLRSKLGVQFMEVCIDQEMQGWNAGLPRDVCRGYRK